MLLFVFCYWRLVVFQFTHYLLWISSKEFGRVSVIRYKVGKVPAELEMLGRDDLDGVKEFIII